MKISSQNFFLGKSGRVHETLPVEINPTKATMGKPTNSWINGAEQDNAVEQGIAGQGKG